MYISRFFSKSFCWGIIIASLTWLTTIILYFHITKNYSIKIIVKDKSGSATISSSNRNFVLSTVSSAYLPLFNNNNNTAVKNYVSQRREGNQIKPSQSKIFKFKDNLSELGLVRGPEDQHIRDFGYKQHAFNALVSNNLKYFRDIPDTRHLVCTQNNYTSIILPSASIVMCFFNEHQMTLLRSINTVLQRTPNELLTEIILVDDFSYLPDLKAEFIQKLKNIDVNGKVRLLRNDKREGLIRSRVIGAREAIGDVLIFLDSHIEVNTDWIQPLLMQVSKENSTLAVPVIDIINPDTFKYTPSPLVRGGFNWGLHFKWENLPKGTLINTSSFSGPFNSPSMAGGLFAVNRQYFKHIGEYDMGMDIWGGENLEISFRVWQCGGAIKIMPCSRVGHIFRKRRPYGSVDGSNTMLKNSLRLAYVWMDEFKDIFLRTQKLSSSYDYGSVDDRIELRKKLKCQPFSWYLKNIYPELQIPGKENNSIKNNPDKISFRPWNLRKRIYKRSFNLKLSNTNLCLAVKSSKKESGLWKRGSSVVLKPCLQGSKDQIWYETEKAELVIDKLYCLETSSDDSRGIPVLGKCHEMGSEQEWRWVDNKHSPIFNSATGTCMRAKNTTVGALVYLDICSRTTLNIWDFVENK